MAAIVMTLSVLEGIPVLQAVASAIFRDCGASSIHLYLHSFLFV